MPTKRTTVTGPRRKTWGKQSPYRGVYPTPWGKWRAMLWVSGRLHQAGGHPDPETAARAYDALARKLLGSDAVVNFAEVCWFVTPFQGQNDG